MTSQWLFYFGISLVLPFRGEATVCEPDFPLDSVLNFSSQASLPSEHEPRLPAIENHPHFERFQVQLEALRQILSERPEHLSETEQQRLVRQIEDFERRLPSLVLERLTERIQTGAWLGNELEWAFLNDLSDWRQLQILQAMRFNRLRLRASQLIDGQDGQLTKSDFDLTMEEWIKDIERAVESKRINQAIDPEFLKDLWHQQRIRLFEQAFLQYMSGKEERIVAGDTSLIHEFPLRDIVEEFELKLILQEILAKTISATYMQQLEALAVATPLESEDLDSFPGLFEDWQDFVDDRIGAQNELNEQLESAEVEIRRIFEAFGIENFDIFTAQNSDTENEATMPSSFSASEEVIQHLRQYLSIQRVMHLLANGRLGEPGAWNLEEVERLGILEKLQIELQELELYYKATKEREQARYEARRRESRRELALQFMSDFEGSMQDFRLAYSQKEFQELGGFSLSDIMTLPEAEWLFSIRRQTQLSQNRLIQINDFIIAAEQERAQEVARLRPFMENSALNFRSIFEDQSDIFQEEDAAHRQNLFRNITQELEDLKSQLRNEVWSFFRNENERAEAEKAHQEVEVQLMTLAIQQAITSKIQGGEMTWQAVLDEIEAWHELLKREGLEIEIQSEGFIDNHFLSVAHGVLNGLLQAEQSQRVLSLQMNELQEANRDLTIAYEQLQKQDEFENLRRRPLELQLHRILSQYPEEVQARLRNELYEYRQGLMKEVAEAFLSTREAEIRRAMAETKTETNYLQEFLERTLTRRNNRQGWRRYVMLPHEVVIESFRIVTDEGLWTYAGEKAVKVGYGLAKMGEGLHHTAALFPLAAGQWAEMITGQRRDWGLDYYNWIRTTANEHWGGSLHDDLKPLVKNSVFGWTPPGRFAEPLSFISFMIKSSILPGFGLVMEVPLELLVDIETAYQLHHYGVLNEFELYEMKMQGLDRIVQENWRLLTNGGITDDEVTAVLSSTFFAVSKLAIMSAAMLKMGSASQAQARGTALLERNLFRPIGVRFAGSQTAALNLGYGIAAANMIVFNFAMSGAATLGYELYAASKENRIIRWLNVAFDTLVGAGNSMFYTAAMSLSGQAIARASYRSATGRAYPTESQARFLTRDQRVALMRADHGGQMFSQTINIFEASSGLSEYMDMAVATTNFQEFMGAALTVLSYLMDVGDVRFIEGQAGAYRSRFHPFDAAKAAPKLTLGAVILGASTAVRAPDASSASHRTIEGQVDQRGYWTQEQQGDSSPYNHNQD
ncbi:MAG: hypothetical protein EA369_04335 [Bradymonadales bacterium]|nr:MAG: hypothetical protein EA369_04335 [Bradymonadales bacterium]